MTFVEKSIFVEEKNSFCEYIWIEIRLLLPRIVIGKLTTIVICIYCTYIILRTYITT